MINIFLQIRKCRERAREREREKSRKRTGIRERVVAFLISISFIFTMCPPAPEASSISLISSCRSDDQIIVSLNQIIRGSPIPDDVIIDNPYQYNPTNLPGGAWFLMSSSDRKESQHGIWNALGEATKVYSNSAICGWRTTFEFTALYVPIDSEIIWMIQEFKVTQNDKYDQAKLKDSILCNVFCGQKLNVEIKPENHNDDIDLMDLLDQQLFGETQVSNNTERPDDKFADLSDDSLTAELDRLITPPPPEFDDVMGEDYIELDDLLDDLERWTSSDNSSSLSSEECFDSLALLRDLENEMIPDMVEAEAAVKEREVEAKDIEEVGVDKDESASKASPEQAAKRLKAEHANEGPSQSYRAAASSSSRVSSSSREEKRMKKLTKYFCFLSF